MKNLIKLLLSALLISTNAIGQDLTFLDCLTKESTSTTTTKANLCSDNKPPNNSALYNNVYAQMSHWIPELNYENLTVRVAFHVFNDNNGSGTDYPQSQNTIDQVNQMISWVNSFYGNCSPSDPISGVQDLDFTKIEFDLSDRIYFYENSSLNNCNAFSKIQFLEQNHPERLIYLPILIGPGGCGQFARLPYPDFISTGGVTASDIEGDSYTFISGLGYTGAQSLAHEFGHNLDLKHTYEPSCCHESCDQSSFDYLSDVFGTAVQSSCWHDGGFNCDLQSSSNSCTNNMMGGVNTGCYYFSPLQIGKMNRSLSIKSVRKYVDPDSKINSPYHVSSDEDWDFDIRMHRDIVVDSGAELIISCRLLMGNKCKIVVKPGGKLIVDGGIIIKPLYSKSFWQGIEVHGNYQLRQNTSNQGIVEVINDGVIEFAQNGIRTIGRKNNGTLDWTKTGGIVRINGGTFKDCRRGIEFMSYQNISPNGNELSNISFISNAKFITTDDYLEDHSPYAGITLFAVNGVRIRNFIFENQRSDLADLLNPKRGSGIISVDANYNVTSGYNLQTGVPIAGTENEFRNLYYGVMTYGGTGRSDVKINDNLFEECIYGVGLMGCNYGIIGRNQFNILEFNNDPTNPIGFGVYTDGAYGFNIEGNDFDILGSSTNVNHHAVNVRNSSNNTSSGKVYRNNIDNVYLGTQTIGNNTALRIDCNDYVKGAFSTVDINHAEGVLADQGDCGQFSFGVPVNNTFSGMCNNTTLAQLFKSPSADPFVYNYQAGSLDPSCHNLGSNAVNCLFGREPNECPVTLANNAITIVDARISLWKSKLGGTKESLNTVREIIAYGDREELDLTIEDESNELSKDSLLAASPYLSDRILIEYLTQSNTPPSGHIKQVLLANSPLTDAVLSVVNGLNLPNRINNQISQAQQTGISERRLLEASESNLNTDLLVYIDAIVQEYLDTNWVDSAALFLREEGSLEALCALVPIEVRRNDTIRANSIIDTLRTVASGMESSNTSCKRACELNEFCDFQQFVFRIALRQGGYFSLNQDERSVLEQVVNSDARVAVNAKAILHFIDETLPMYKGKDLVFPKSMNSEDDLEKLLKQEKEEQLFTVHQPYIWKCSLFNRIRRYG